jgi:hypothetical protein
MIIACKCAISESKTQPNYNVAPKRSSQGNNCSCMVRPSDRMSVSTTRVIALSADKNGEVLAFNYMSDNSTIIRCKNNSQSTKQYYIACCHSCNWSCLAAISNLYMCGLLTRR